MRLVWAVLCSQSVRDADSNNISLLNVTEQINMRAEIQAPDEGALPDVFPILSDRRFVILWSRSDLDVPESGLFKVRLVAEGLPDKDTEAQEIDLEKYRRYRATLNIAMIPFNTKRSARQLVQFIVYLQQDDGEWVEVAWVPLELNVELSVVESPSNVGQDVTIQSGTKT